MGREGRLSILIYHRVLARPDPLQPALPDALTFERHMRWLCRCCRVLPLAEAVACLHDGTLPARAVSITFDDGYADNAEVALPILLRLRLPATFFIATGYLDGGRMWNDTIIETIRRWPYARLVVPGRDGPAIATADEGQRRAAIPQVLGALKYVEPAARIEAAHALAGGLDELTALPRPMMTRAQVRALTEAGMTVGAHTHTHPILTRLPIKEAEGEIAQSRETLEAITGAGVTLFAYPNGVPGRDYSVEHVALLRRLGFRAAVTTSTGVARPGNDPLQLPRFTPWDRPTWRFLVRFAHARLRAGPGQVAADAAEVVA